MEHHTATVKSNTAGAQQTADSAREAAYVQNGGACGVHGAEISGEATERNSGEGGSCNEYFDLFHD